MMSFQNYFVYKGKTYGVGTKAKIVSSANFSIIRGTLTKTNSFDEVKEQIYTFTGGTTDGKFTFWWRETDDPWEQKYVARSQVTIKNPNNEILEIVEPVYVHLVSWQEKAIDNMVNKKATVDVFGGALMYVIIMLLALIFKDRWAIWIVATAIFGWWLLNQYRT
jgi:hypothetical protein